MPTFKPLNVKIEIHEDQALRGFFLLANYHLGEEKYCYSYKIQVQ